VEENWEAEELTVPELRAALSKRRLPTGGRKMDLGERCFCCCCCCSLAFVPILA
jgi:hypothetical protein